MKKHIDPANNESKQSSTLDNLQEATIEQIDNKLSAILFRLDCPEPEVLLNYQWGLLEEEETLVVAAHLAECLHCTREAIQLAPPTNQGQTLSSLSFETMKEKLRLFVGHLVPLNPILSSVRGHVATQTKMRGYASTNKVYIVDELEWHVTISHYLEKDETYTLQGQLLGQMETFKASLLRENAPIATVDLNETGVFVFSLISTGSYTLCFHTPQVKVFISDTI